MNDSLITIVALSLLGWGLMWLDYGLTLLVARPLRAAGLRYELNPALRADVAAGRWFSPRFALGAGVILLALLAIGWMAQAEHDNFVFNATLAGLVVTRLHLIGLHLRNGWRHARGRTGPVTTARQAMLRIAAQQTLLAALFILPAVWRLAPQLYAVWVGAATGFLLMAATTLLWYWHERRTPTLHTARALPSR